MDNSEYIRILESRIDELESRIIEVEADSDNDSVLAPMETEGPIEPSGTGLPEFPGSDGDYSLHLVISSGASTLSWDEHETFSCP